MHCITIDLDEELAGLLPPNEKPIEENVREMLVLELYRRGSISSGKGAQLLGWARHDFIRQASAVGIAYLDLSPDEWASERDSGLEL